MNGAKAFIVYTPFCDLRGVNEGLLAAMGQAMKTRKNSFVDCAARWAPKQKKGRKHKN